MIGSGIDSRPRSCSALANDAGPYARADRSPGKLKPPFPSRSYRLPNSHVTGPLENPEFTPVTRSVAASLARGLISNALRPATALLGMVGIGSNGPQVDPCTKPLVDARARPPSWVQSDELRPFVADPPSRHGTEPAPKR